MQAELREGTIVSAKRLMKNDHILRVITPTAIRFASNPKIEADPK
jgi:hypothetical protein